MESWVIFDLDGTLIESEQIWRDVRRAFALEHGGRWHDGAQTAMIGMRTAQWSQYMHDDLGVPLPPQTIADGVANGVIDALNRHMPLLPGANDVLERLSGAFRLALATAATQRVADFVVAKTGWDKRFSIVVSADQVERGKPAPDVYLRALELAGANANASAAVEDSTNGIRSAHAAALAVIAIPNREFPPEASALALASRVLKSLNEIDERLIRSIVGS